MSGLGHAVFAAVLAAAPVGSPPPAPVDQVALDEVRGATVMADVRFLADDLLEGRKSGTRGYELAAKYVAARLETMGLLPAGDEGTFFQAVPLRESRLVEGKLSVRAGGGAPVALAMREDFLMSGELVHTHSRVEAQVVFAGFGVTAPELDHDDYAGLDVAGKVVAVLRNAPARFPSEPRAHYASGRLKAENAARRGAVGLLVFAAPEDQRRVPWARVVENPDFTAVCRLLPDGTPVGVEPALRGSALLGPEGARRLFASSPVPLEAVFTQAAEGRPRGFELGVTVELESRSEHRHYASPNVVGLLEGSDPGLRATSVVLSAHLDHIGIGAEVEGDRIYNGAYDNAMGAAVVLEAARVFADRERRPPRSVVFLFATSEEDGLIGSDHFASRPPARAGGIVANVNVDMPLFLYPLADLVAFGGENSSLGDAAARAAREAGLDLSPDPMPEENVFVRSDQYSFVRQGIPAVFLVPGFRSSDPTVDGRKQFGEFLARHYHRPSDDLGRTVHPESLARFVRVNVALVHALASDPAAPRWKPGNFFGETFGRPVR